MKHLSLELCKRLQEEGIMEGVETEEFYFLNSEGVHQLITTDRKWKPREGEFKAPNFEEAMELILDNFGRAGFIKRIPSTHKIKESLAFPYGIYVGMYPNYMNDWRGFKTKIQALEIAITDLLDNNKLGKQK